MNHICKKLLMLLVFAGIAVVPRADAGLFRRRRRRHRRSYRRFMPVKTTTLKLSGKGYSDRTKAKARKIQLELVPVEREIRCLLRQLCWRGRRYRRARRHGGVYRIRRRLSELRTRKRKLDKKLKKRLERD